MSFFLSSCSFADRIRFLLESLHDLNMQLEKYGSSLHVVQGHLLMSMESVCEKWNVKKLYFQADRDIRSYVVEDSVVHIVKSRNIKVYIIKDTLAWWYEETYIGQNEDYSIAQCFPLSQYCGALGIHKYIHNVLLFLAGGV